MVYTGAAAKKRALGVVGKSCKPGYCLYEVRTDIFGVPGKYPSAISALRNAKKRHTGKPPSGAVVPVFFDTRSPYEHVAATTGDGRIVTINGSHWRIYSSIQAFTRAWGCRYLGWTEDLNGVTLYTPARKKAKYTNVTALQKAVGAQPDNSWGTDSVRRTNAIRAYAYGRKKPYGVKYLQGVLKVKQDGKDGPLTHKAHEAAVKRIQKAVGVTADGDWGTKTDAAVKAKVKGAKKS